MDTTDDRQSVGQINCGSKKKQRIGRQRDILKNDKYKDKDPLALNFTKNCTHGSNKTFKCNNVEISLVVKNRNLFYKNKTKVSQDGFLTRLISAITPERKRTFKPTCKPKPHTVSCFYHLIGKKKKLIRVCKKTFMNTFSIKPFRLRAISKHVFNGTVPKENRGGNHKFKKYAAKKESVCKFITNLPAKESHYNRNKSKRIYLNSDLNISKLWKFYNDTVENDIKVKRSMFRNIFNTEFNIGFSSPSSDACGACILLKNRIKNEKNLGKKQELITEKRIHKLRANAFYELTRSKPEKSLSFCFDLQQVLPLPRTPIQDAFYSRQISLYNLCFVDMKANHPVFFTWDETQSRRGATEVGSALLNYLMLQDYTDIETVRLFCDGCGGQNKNSHIIHTMLFWLVNHSPTQIKQIQITYPVRGHSFLPADRVFGRIEKEIKKYPIITTKEEYYEHFKKFGEVKILGQNWKLYDIKKLCDYYKKVNEIRNIKRIYIVKTVSKTRNGVTNKYLVTSYEHFRFESRETWSCLLKNKKQHPRILMQFTLGHPVTGAKKGDVKNLLIKQFGENWDLMPELEWYKGLLCERSTPPPMSQDEEENRENEECDCLELDIQSLRV